MWNGFLADPVMDRASGRSPIWRPPALSGARYGRLQRYCEHGPLAGPDVTDRRTVKCPVDVNDFTQRRKRAATRTVSAELVHKGHRAAGRYREDRSADVGTLYCAVECSVYVEQPGLRTHLVLVLARLPEAAQYGRLAFGRYLENRTSAVTPAVGGRAVEITLVR